jgi:hypothetical protein
MSTPLDLHARIDRIMTGLWFRHIRADKPKLGGRPQASLYHPTEADLIDFEKELGHTLPIDYRVFLQYYGITAFNNKVRFPMPGEGGEFDWVWVFFGYSPGDIYHIQNKWTSKRSSIGDTYLPIACTDATGATILLSLTDSQFGTLYYIDRETFWEYEEASEGGADFLEFAVKISNSFMAFLESLQGEDPVNRAVSWGTLEELRHLLETGHATDLRDSLGDLPCENAVGPGMGVEKLRALLEHGAPAGCAIVTAVKFKDIDQVKLLLDHGADPTVRDRHGQTAMQQAQAVKSDAIISLIRARL